jgi:hypothetical protein
MSDEHIAEWLAETFEMDHDEELERLHSLQGDSQRKEENGELWFWAVYKALL